MKEPAVQALCWRLFIFREVAFGLSACGGYVEGMWRVRVGLLTWGRPGAGVLVLGRRGQFRFWERTFGSSTVRGCVGVWGLAGGSRRCVRRDVVWLRLAGYM